MLRAIARCACALAAVACSRSAPAVAPVEHAGRYVFAAGDTTLEIDPKVGGRIVAFSLEGKNFLTGTEADPDNYGSTFWTSPQSDWGWPPVPEIDNLPYHPKVAGSALVLQGPVSSKLGLSVTKTFFFDASSRTVTIGYGVANHGNRPRALAPWEITRVHPGGITMFRAGPNTDERSSALPTTRAAGFVWFRYDAGAIDHDAKLFADGEGGILAQIDGDYALVKTFDDVPFDQHAPQEGEIEIFANRAHTYIEIENQGRFATLAPGASTTYTMRWTLRRIPSEIDKKVGSESLVRWIESIARER
jgi:hypothetical protein